MTGANTLPYPDVKDRGAADFCFATDATFRPRWLYSEVRPLWNVFRLGIISSRSESSRAP